MQTGLPMHLHSLISAFVVPCLHKTFPLSYAVHFKLVCVVESVCFSLTWLKITKTGIFVMMLIFVT